MRRTRRKRRYTWFPIDGTPNTTEADFGICTTTTLALDVPADGNPVQAVDNITFDQDQDTVTTGLSVPNTSLVSLLGNEYFLKRIVGKVFVNLRVSTAVAIQTPDNLRPVIVTAGFFIARQDNVDPTKPLSWSTRADDYNIMSTTVIREPWIWRRSWVVGIGTTFLPENTNMGGNISDVLCFPCSNVAYGSVADGPHLDAKTARRVRQEERLYFTATAQTYPVAAAITGPTNTEVAIVGYDVRLLGALRKAHNRGSL